MLKQSFTLLLILLVTGCASSIHSTRIDANKGLPAQHGVVAVQVINNADKLAPLHPGWTEVLAVRTDNMEALKQAATAKAKENAKEKRKKFDEDKVDWDPEIYSLTPLSRGVINSQMFVGSMPEGSYMIARLYSFYSDGNMSSWFSMPVFEAAGRFDVKQNQLTNLGSLVFQPLLSVKEKSFWSHSSSRKAYVTRLQHQPDLTSFVKTYYPKIAESVDWSEQLSWQQDNLSELRAQLGDLSRNNAIGSHGLPLTHFGQAIVAARFGQLRLLDQQGNWQQIDLPTNAQMSALLETKQQLVAGGEQGQLFITNDLTNWQQHQPVAPDQAIIWLGKGTKGTYALTSAAKAYKLYLVNNLTDDWQPIGSFTKKAGATWLVQNGGLFPIITEQGDIRVLNDNKLYDYDPISKQWRNKKASAMKKLVQLPNGVLLGVDVSQWDGIGDQVVSYDMGESWQEISRRLDFFGDNKSDASLPAMLNLQQMVTLGRVKQGKKKGSKLHILHNPTQQLEQKNQWQIAGQPKANCETLLPQLSTQSRLFFLCDQGQIVSTGDLGQSWQQEVEMDIAAMQTEFDALVKAMKEQAEKEKAAEGTTSTATP